MTNATRELWRNQLTSLADSVKIVVLHPLYPKHRLLLSDLLEENGTLYMRFEGKKLKKADIDSQFEGKVTNQSSSLAEIRWLILDECDRLDDKHLSKFLTSVITQLPVGRVLMISRNISSRLLIDDKLKEVTRFVPSDNGMLLVDYSQRNSDRLLLEVHSFGHGSVFLNGTSINHWDGALPRSLFFYLIDRGMVTRNDIFEVFWPKLSVREATNVFHVTKRKISEVLGIDLTVYWSGFYRISPDIDLTYDVIQFTELVQSSVLDSPAEASVKLEQALALYKGVFLSSINFGWATSRRDELFQMYGEALISLAEHRVEDNRLQDALGFYIRAMRANPHREDLVGYIMDLYLKMNMPHDALETYERFEVALQQHLRVQPGETLQLLAADARRSIS